MTGVEPKWIFGGKYEEHEEEIMSRGGSSRRSIGTAGRSGGGGDTIRNLIPFYQ